MSLIPFRLYSDDGRERGRIHINPAAVASVEESERRPSDRFYQQVAIVRMLTGETHVVCDYDHRAATLLTTEDTKK